LSTAIIINPTHAINNTTATTTLPTPHDHGLSLAGECAGDGINHDGELSDEEEEDGKESGEFTNHHRLTIK